MQTGLEHHTDHLGFAVRVGGEIDHTRTGFTLRQVIFFVACYTGHVEALHIVDATLAVAVNDVIYRALVFLFEDVDMDDIGADKDLLGYFHHFVFAVLVEDNDVVDIRTIADEFVLLEARADESFFSVDIEFLVGLGYRSHVDCSEIAHLRAARILGSVLGFEHLKPFDRIVRQMVQILLAFFDLLGQILHQFVRLLRVELGDADHLDFKQTLNIFFAHLADQFVLPRFQCLIYKSNQFLLVRSRLITFLLIDAVLDKNLLQRGVEVFFLQLCFLDL